MQIKHFVIGATLSGLLSTTAIAGNLGTNFNLTMAPATGGMGGMGYVRPQDPFASVMGNVATIGQVDGTDFIFGAVYTRVEPATAHDGSVVPAFDTSTNFNNFIAPTMAVRHRLNDKLSFGMGLGATAGLASDFRSASLNPVVTYIVFGANMALAYEVNDKLTVGAGVQLAYSLFEVGLTSNTSIQQDIGVRGMVGFTYDLGQVMIGGTYQSNLKFTWDEVTAVDVGPQGLIFDDVALTQPQEIEIGIATTDAFSEKWLFELDAIWLNYSDATLFEDIWVDQYIIGLGAQYKTGKWALRAGYNYHLDLRRNDVSDVTSLSNLTQLVAPVGENGAPVPVPVTPGFVQLVQATLAQPYWNHQVSSGVGYQFNDSMRVDLSATLAFGDPEDFGGNTLTDIWEFHAQFGFAWAF